MNGLHKMTDAQLKELFRAIPSSVTPIDFGGNKPAEFQVQDGAAKQCTPLQKTKRKKR